MCLKKEVGRKWVLGTHDLPGHMNVENTESWLSVTERRGDARPEVPAVASDTWATRRENRPNNKKSTFTDSSSLVCDFLLIDDSEAL